ncbi:MAG TPA: SDR family NAD(P)-dependent oxidoreductase [Solirubrobacteraceae bacterium]|nr:SDR family NAD(P)-dependent oxidoreductase [Solirubrobacteraceae bacterium]
MEIQGARALVVGGASGLGAATARRLAAGGAVVTIADVNAEAGKALAGELGATFARCDVRDPAQVDEAVIAARGDGVLRIAVTCAGVGWAEKTAGRRGPHAVEPFHTVIAVNLLGSFHLLRAAGMAMLGNERDAGGEAGVIVMTASIAAYDGQVGQLAYSASKGGVVGMTLPAARDLAGNGVRVCTIAPGLFDTPLLAGLPEEARAALGAQVPHPARLGDPAEYAALAAHIVENPMLNGEVVRLDGALRMPPR